MGWYLGAVQVAWLMGTYLLMMLTTASITLTLPAHVVPSLMGHWGLLHLLSIFDICCYVLPFVHARQGKMKMHPCFMVSLYVGPCCLLDRSP